MGLFNWVVSKHFPFQLFLNRCFVKLYAIDLSEYGPVESYCTLQDLFTRKLTGKRALKEGIISPVDGTITEFGTVEKGMAFQIKGRPYKVDELMDEDIDLENWVYVNFYLSPKNYHRYHAPCDMKIVKLKRIPGRLLPVNHFFLRNKRNLFAGNKRAVLECDNLGKKFYMVFVGAFKVGSINFNFSKQTFIRKGEEIGFFNFGSTVVMFFESLNKNIKKGAISFGDSIGK